MNYFKEYVKRNKEDIINTMIKEFNYSEKIKALRDLNIIRSDKDIEVLVNHCFDNAIELIKEKDRVYYTEEFVSVVLSHIKEDKISISSFYYKTTKNEHDYIPEAIEEFYLTYIEDLSFDLQDLDRHNLLDLLIEKDRKIRQLQYNIRVLEETK